MKQRIAHVSIHQSSKLLAIVYGILGLIVSPLIWLSSLADPTGAMPLWLVLLFPVIYAVMGYIFTAMFVAVYNAVAAQTGGIEMTVVSDTDPNGFA